MENYKIEIKTTCLRYSPTPHHTKPHTLNNRFPPLSLYIRRMAASFRALSAALPNQSLTRSPPRFLAATSLSLRLNSVSYTPRRGATRASMAEIVTPKSKGKVKVFDTEEHLAVSLAEYAADLSKKSSQRKDSFTVVLSGGSLVKSLRYISDDSQC